MKRFGSTTWNGGLREGTGAVSTESRALENYPYSFFTATQRHFYRPLAVFSLPKSQA
jgi:hypothetical protein